MVDEGNAHEGCRLYASCIFYLFGLRWQKT